MIVTAGHRVQDVRFAEVSSTCDDTEVTIGRRYKVDGYDLGLVEVISPKESWVAARLSPDGEAFAEAAYTVDADHQSTPVKNVPCVGQIWADLTRETDFCVALTEPDKYEILPGESGSVVVGLDGGGARVIGVLPLRTADHRHGAAVSLYAAKTVSHRGRQLTLPEFVAACKPDITCFHENRLSFVGRIQDQIATAAWRVFSRW